VAEALQPLADARQPLVQVAALHADAFTRHQHRERLGEVARGGGDPIATTTSARRVVTLPLEADRQDIVAEGDAVGIELPDGTLTDGTVEEVGRVARTTDRGDTVVDLTIALDDPVATGSLDGAPVTVRITRETREEVLAVPVDALLALAEGGYAVEVADADGTTRLVGVETGLFADGRVEVTGEIGDSVDVWSTPPVRHLVSIPEEAARRLGIRTPAPAVTWVTGEWDLQGRVACIPVAAARAVFPCVPEDDRQCVRIG
jgi:hypothetical protein